MNYSPNNELNHELDSRTDRALNFFWAGYIIYIVCWAYPAKTSVDYTIFQSLQMIGMFMFVVSAVSIMRWEFDYNYLRIVFTFFVLWSLLVIVRGFQFNYYFIKDQLLNAWFGIFIYMAPLVLLFPKNIFFFKKTFTAVFVLSCFYVFYDLLHYRVLLWGLGGNRFSTGVIETFSHTLSIPSGFIIMTYLYHNNRRVLIAGSIIILTFILASIRARRGLMFMTMTILLVSFIIYYFTNRGKILRVILSFFMVILLAIYGREVYSSNRGGMFGLITSRADEDTRTDVVEYFNSSMSTKDWILGKGVNGQYYCPGIDEIAGTVTTNRSVIETGYLQIILKGGLVSLVFMLLIWIPAIIKGLFHSKNLFTKAAALWILLFIIYSYPTNINGFTMNHLMIWFSTGVCYSRVIRAMSDEEIGALLS